MLERIGGKGVLRQLLVTEGATNTYQVWFVPLEASPRSNAQCFGRCNSVGGLYPQLLAQFPEISLKALNPFFCNISFLRPLSKIS